MSGEAGAIAPRTVRLSGEIADQPILDALAAAYPKAAIGHAYASTEAGVGFEVTDGREGFPVDFLDYAGGCVELAVAEGTLRVRSRRAAVVLARIVVADQTKARVCGIALDDQLGVLGKITYCGNGEAVHVPSPR